jgi:hypothetical protein
VKETAIVPKTHDFTKQGWGYATSGWNTKDGGLTVSCCGWGRGISRGDYILLKNGSADTRYLFEEIEYYRDPSDMWHAKLKFAPRFS